MRKRSKEEMSSVDNSESRRGNKHRRKTKSSDRFARDLQRCESTLDDAERIFAQLKSRIAHNACIRKLCYNTESFDLPMLPTPSAITSPNFLEEDTLSLPMPPIPSTKTLPNFLEENTLSSPMPPIPRAITSPNFLEENTLPLPMPPIPSAIPSPDFLEENTLSVPMPPIPSAIPSPNVLEENTLSPPMPPMPACMVSSASFELTPTSEHRSDFVEGKIEHHVEIAEDIVSACADGSDEIPSLCKELPSEMCGNIEALKGSDSLSFEMQRQHFSELPCPQVLAEETSNIFVLFLKRLTQYGILIDYTTSPGFVKKVLSCHQAGDTQQTAAEESKEVEAEKQSEQSSSLVRRTQEVAEESKEFEPEKQFETSSLLSQEVAEEPKQTKPEKQFETNSLLFTGSEEVAPQKQFEARSLSFSRSEEVVSESDKEDDGFKHIWDDMEFSLACMNEPKRSQAEVSNNKNDGCNHEFYKKDDMGLVCSLCGLVGQDTEYIFSFIWGEGSSKKRSGNQVAVAKPSTAPVVEELSDGLEVLSVQQTDQPIVLDPKYRDKLHAHQEDGLRFLQRNLVQDEPSGCILAHAPGTGKTFLIIAFLQSFLTFLPNEKPVIVAPKGMLSVWVREFHKWGVDEEIAIFNLHEALALQEQVHNDSHVLSQLRHCQLQMLRQWKVQKSVLLVGYSTFSKLISDNDGTGFLEIKKMLLEATGLLVLDEGHFPRNKETRILKSLSQVHTKRRVLLSGTLFQNNFDELYNLYHLVRPDFMSLNSSCTKALLETLMKANLSPSKVRLTPSKSSKQRSAKEAMELKMFEDLGETIRWGDKEEKRQAISQLRQLSKPFVHWYKGLVLEELPGLIDLTLILKLTGKQEELLSSLQDKVENQLDRAIKSTKACIHPTLLKTDSDAAHNSDIPLKDSEEDPQDSVKIMFVLDLLQLSVASKEKVLLFSQLLDPFYLLERMLKKFWGWQLNKEILKIEGRTPLEEREATIDKFNLGSKARILFASIKTCGEGVSLIGASRIVILDVQWNPMVSRQAISRAFRIGQKKKVFVYRLVGKGAMEEDAHIRACEKEWLAKQIFEGSTDDDYAAYSHEVNPREVDTYFESQHLGENVLSCYRCHFV